MAIVWIERNREKHLLFAFMRHPLLTAMISYGLLALVILSFSSRFQQENWNQQFKLQQEKNHQDNLYRQRAEIAGELFYLLSEYDQAMFNIFHSGRDFAIGTAIAGSERMDLKQIAARHAERIQEINSRMKVLRLKLEIFYGQELESITRIAQEICMDCFNAIAKMNPMVSRTRFEMKAIQEDFTGMEKELNDLDKKHNKLIHVLANEIAKSFKGVYTHK